MSGKKGTKAPSVATICLSLKVVINHHLQNCIFNECLPFGYGCICVIFQQMNVYGRSIIQILICACEIVRLV